MKRENVSQVDSEHIQLCLPGTHDLHFVVNAAKTYCNCSYREPGAPPLLCCELPWPCSAWCVCGGRDS